MLLIYLVYLALRAGSSHCVLMVVEPAHQECYNNLWACQSRVNESSRVAGPLADWAGGTA